MIDILVIVATVVFFVAAMAYVVGCDGLAPIAKASGSSDRAAS